MWCGGGEIQERLSIQEWKEIQEWKRKLLKFRKNERILQDMFLSIFSLCSCVSTEGVPSRGNGRATAARKDTVGGHSSQGESLRKLCQSNGFHPLCASSLLILSKAQSYKWRVSGRRIEKRARGGRGKHVANNG